MVTPGRARYDADQYSPWDVDMRITAAILMVMLAAMPPATTASATYSAVPYEIWHRASGETLYARANEISDVAEVLCLENHGQALHFPVDVLNRFGDMHLIDVSVRRSGSRGVSFVNIAFGMSTPTADDPSALDVWDADIALRFEQGTLVRSALSITADDDLRAIPVGDPAPTGGPALPVEDIAFTPRIEHGGRCPAPLPP